MISEKWLLKFSHKKKEKKRKKEKLAHPQEPRGESEKLEKITTSLASQIL